MNYHSQARNKMNGTSNWIWETYLRALRQYSASGAGGVPPKSHVEHVDGVGDVDLGRWCMSIRRRNRQQTLTPEQRASVEAASPNWSWEIRSYRLVGRNQEIRALRREGLSMQKIADRYGITRQRVHSLLQDEVVA